MFELPIFSDLAAWFNQYYVSLLWSAGLILLHMIIVKWTLPKIRKGVKISKLNEESALKAFNIMRIIIGTLTIAAILIVWGIDFSGLLLVSTSLITITGVALFANWSLLSNITAYFILLFQPSYSRGNFIRIFEGDNFVEGTICEVNLFNIKIITDDREVIMYPSNILLTRVIMLNPRRRLQGYGKLLPTVSISKEHADNSDIQSDELELRKVGKVKDDEAK